MQDNKLTATKTTTVNTNCGDLNVLYREGDSAPLVAVHGLFGSSHTYHGLLDHIPKRHSVFALNLPGYGGSQPAPSFAPSWENFADSVISAADALGLEHFDLIGHSMGGGISVVAAARHPERVDKLLLVDAVSYPYRVPLKGRLPLLPIIGPLLFKHYNRQMFINYFKYDVFLDPAKLNLASAHHHYELFNRNRDWQLKCLRATANPAPVAAAVAEVKAETLVLWGERDSLVPLSVGRKLKNNLPKATLEVIPNCGHSPLEEQTADTAARIINFLS